MKNSLFYQFVHGRRKLPALEYTKYLAFRTADDLNEVMPKVHENLKEHAQAFVKAVIGGDVEFIREVSTLALQGKMEKEFQLMKNMDVQFKIVDKKGEDDKFKQKVELTEEELKKKNFDELTVKDLWERDLRFSISPYVIFGDKMEERIELEDPWKNLYKILSFNSFLNCEKKQTWKSISQDHVYGFNCFMRFLRKQIEVTQKGQT